jgi:DNA repair exonuclease SbcCD ATPase subunit
VDAIKDVEGNWKVKESSLRSMADSYRASERSGRTVQGASIAQNAPTEDVLKESLERMLEPLRKALEREMERVKEAQARIRELEAKVEARDARIAQLQEERIADVKEGVPAVAILQALLEKMTDLEVQANQKTHGSKLTDTFGSLFSQKGRR